MINITNLSVRYKDTLAIDNINLQIDKPSIIGIIGPNGAGKSTLIKAILNIIPFKGKAEIDNLYANKESYRKGVHNLRTQRSHTSTTTNPNHLLTRSEVRMEVTQGS